MKTMTFDEVKEQFLVEKKISSAKKTYIGYCGKLNIFSGWLKDNGYSNIPMSEIDDAVIHDFFIYLATIRDLDKATCGKYKDSLGIFFRFSIGLKQSENLPFGRIVLPQKKKDHRPKYIPANKQKALYNDIRENDYQLYLGCMIQYCSAVRPGREMLSLKVKDFNFKDGTILVGELNAKTGKRRYADLTEELIGYCKEYGMEEVDPNLYIFGRHRTFGDTFICENNLTWRFNQFRDKHGIDKGVKFYSNKHSGATDLINAKLISLPQLMKHLGHTRITSTEHYIIEHIGVTNDIIKQQFKSPMAEAS